MAPTPANFDPREIARFGRMAGGWWQAKGEFKALHDINPVRTAYIAARAGPLRDKKVLDVGCGGGLLSEALAHEGARVTGIDMAPEAVAVACEHATAGGLNIEYLQYTAEQWVQKHAGAYDIVTCMELVEHVPDPAKLVSACARLVRPGGDIFFATVNRTPLAGLLVILAAEYVFGIVRRGTHQYAKFVRPTQLAAWGRAAGLTMRDLSGLQYIPFVGRARLCASVRMNYLMHLSR
jgi:2-polyprenyl-6-hydroxyphenyl methylase / 3-demethylubiquinone-9 3-methyltransferase